MKSLFRNLKTKLLRLKTEIWLKLNGVKSYTINDDLTVDVDGEVDLRFGFQFSQREIPIQFGIVNGGFYCIGLGLTTLKGCPTKVLGNFECHENNLTSLEYSPKEVGGNYCCNNNKLTSLEHCPAIIHGDFECSGNELLDLKYRPNIVMGDFDCSFNELLSHMTDINCDIKGTFMHRTEDENNQINLFETFYEKRYYDPYSHRGLHYGIVLDKSFLSKMKLKNNLDKELIIKGYMSKAISKV